MFEKRTEVKLLTDSEMVINVLIEELHEHQNRLLIKLKI